MGSLVSVQLRRGIHHSFLNRSSEKILCDKRLSIRRRSSIRQRVKKALCVNTPLLRFPTVQWLLWRDQTAGPESSQSRPPLYTYKLNTLFKVYFDDMA
ncbi:hypothetical protein AVEN_174088-1 [Araneus ventricosus]|uniref:Uncharacterized protein n=1 Tax=Araneus ventricosus TaxID=182803 RepID=A0A4Y2C2E3_ARAVE|nr:hypothetical protein AVEN_174088-1 [Araneus ventricosus]